MARRLKLFTGLTGMAAVSAIALAACGQKAADAPKAEDPHGSHRPAVGSPEGEGEGAVLTAAATDKPAFLSGLLLIEGHLRAGTGLYEAGDAAMAATHMKHPRDEIYAALAPAFAAFGAPGFERELEALAASVAGGQSADTVAVQFEAVRSAINAASGSAAPTTKEALLAASKTLGVAAAEFDIAVKQGALVNAHEYQDAYGFMTATLDMLGRLDPAGEAEKNAVTLAQGAVRDALSAAPTPFPPHAVPTTSVPIHGAAAKVEIAALGL